VFAGIGIGFLPTRDIPCSLDAAGYPAAVYQLTVHRISPPTFPCAPALSVITPLEVDRMEIPCRSKTGLRSYF